MQPHVLRKLSILLWLTAHFGPVLASCAPDPLPRGSEPINSQEALDYKRELASCLKQGGSRIVKIMGKLRCY